MNITDKLGEILQEIQAFQVETHDQLDAFRTQYIGRKSVIASLFGELKDAAAQDRKALGQQLNELKNTAQDKFRQLTTDFEAQAEAQGAHRLDFTLPPVPDTLGTVHPITQVRQRIIQIFERIGFNISEGPEIEDDWHNFSALNFPPNHPARDMQDTFFIEKNPDITLRTHTSSVQVRVMETQTPPIRTLSPGRVFRNEAISARAHCIFHQVEGLYVDKNVSFKDLKETLLYFAKEMFGKETKIRLRPSYFPFTEPSAELDIYWGLKTEADKRITKGTGWLEIAGCGMVDPNVLKNCTIDPETYTGFAFGMGIERIAMLKYQITDLRNFTENDIRFLRQFSSISI